MTIDLRLGRYEEVLSDARCDALILDAPYSDRTHSGHGTEERWGTGVPPGYDASERREIGYRPWTEADVDACVGFWADRCAGWMVSITDHVLAPAWAAAIAGTGRTVFAPLPFLSPGSRVRLAGDGPSSWTVWIIVGRPKAEKYLRWGTLPGGYHGPSPREGGVVGGKPEWLMRAIVSDYSRPGDTVCDPCAGGATTLIAASGLGRHAIGAEMDPETFAKAQARIKRGVQHDLFAGAPNGR